MRELKPHQAVLIKSGKYAGLVGSVEEVREASVRVAIRGVFEGKTIDAAPWLKPSQLEVQ